MNPLILALDTDDIGVAQKWIEATHASIGTFKMGLEFFLTFGHAGVERLRSVAEFDLFLDLKLHDIPNTVASSVKAIASLQPKFLTVHAAGGSEMISRAAAVDERIGITAVTVLTSLSADELPKLGFAGSPSELAVKLAKNAVDSGARAIVSSPLEVAAIRAEVGDAAIITPGVRPAGSDLGDQKRVMTPADAIAAGSSYLVIGRPITSLYIPGDDGSLAAMKAKAEEIRSSVLPTL